MFCLQTNRQTDIKKKLEDGHKVGGQRNWVQVLCNSAPALVWGALYFRSFGHTLLPLTLSATSPASCPGLSAGESAALATWLQAAFIGHYACCAGDTWASELGILDSGSCRLVTTCRRVPRGTNGGVSLVGTVASAVGGLFIALVYVWLNTFAPKAVEGAVTQSEQWLPVLVMGTAAGLFGSLVGCVFSSFAWICCETHSVHTLPSAHSWTVRWAQLCNIPVSTRRSVWWSMPRPKTPPTSPASICSTTTWYLSLLTLCGVVTNSSILLCALMRLVGESVVCAAHEHRHRLPFAVYLLSSATTRRE